MLHLVAQVRNRFEEESKEAIANADPAQDQQSCLPGERCQQPDHKDDDDDDDGNGDDDDDGNDNGDGQQLCRSRPGLAKLFARRTLSAA